MTNCALRGAGDPVHCLRRPLTDRVDGVRDRAGRLGARRWLRRWRGARRGGGGRAGRRRRGGPGTRRRRAARRRPVASSRGGGLAARGADGGQARGAVAKSAMAMATRGASTAATPIGATGPAMARNSTGGVPGGPGRGLESRGGGVGSLDADDARPRISASVASGTAKRQPGKAEDDGRDREEGGGRRRLAVGDDLATKVGRKAPRARRGGDHRPAKGVEAAGEQVVTSGARARSHRGPAVSGAGKQSGGLLHAASDRAARRDRRRRRRGRAPMVHGAQAVSACGVGAAGPAPRGRGTPIGLRRRCELPDAPELGGHRRADRFEAGPRPRFGLAAGGRR